MANGTRGAALAATAFLSIAAFAAAPGACAQLVPVNLTHEALPDSKLPTRPALLPLPRIEPRKPVKDEHKRLFFVLSAGVYTAAGLDIEQTVALRPHFREYDPLARPLVGLPSAGLLRGRSLVRHRRELARLENGAFAPLAQNLVGSTGDFDRRELGRLLIHPRARVALISPGSTGL